MSAAPLQTGLGLELGREGYRLTERVSSRARRLRIEVAAPGEVRLILPQGVSRQAALAFLQSRDAWIREKLFELEQRLGPVAAGALALRWDGSDRLPLRGIDTPLRVVPAQLRSAVVRFDEGMTLYTPPALLAEPQRLRRCLRQALQHEAERDASRLLAEEAARLRVSYSGPRIADQKTLWGSCAASGLISLSWRLLLAPSAVFRYVVVHELCHRRHHDHSPRFWELVARQMPDYAEHRGWLRRQGSRLQHYLPRN